MFAPHDDPVVSDVDSDAEPTDDGESLAESLAQLQHNFKQLVRQKEAMQDYCDEMQETVEQKEEMVDRLSTKLREVKKNAVATGDTTEANQAPSPEVIRKRRVLPQRPESYRTSTASAQGDGPDYPAVVEEMESKITELEDDCSRLLAALEDANLVAEEQESIARDKALRLKELTELHRNSGVPLGSEMSQDELSMARTNWSEERRAMKDRLRAALEANATLKDLLDESTHELESSERELSQLQRRMNGWISPDGDDNDDAIIGGRGGGEHGHALYSTLAMSQSLHSTLAEELSFGSPSLAAETSLLDEIATSTPAPAPAPATPAETPPEAPAETPPEAEAPAETPPEAEAPAETPGKAVTPDFDPCMLGTPPAPAPSTPAAVRIVSSRILLQAHAVSLPTAVELEPVSPAPWLPGSPAPRLPVSPSSPNAVELELQAKLIRWQTQARVAEQQCESLEAEIVSLGTERRSDHRGYDAERAVSKERMVVLERQIAMLKAELLPRPSDDDGLNPQRAQAAPPMLSRRANTMPALPLPSPPQEQCKGMTHAEQAAVLEDKWMLKEQVDDVQRELVDAKSEMARLLYDRELQNIFMRKRDRILITILSRSLSSGDRERVTQMLKTTGHEAAHRREHGTALNLGAGTRSASTAPVARPKLVISSPVTGSFRRVPLEESMPGVVAAQTPVAEVCENSNETVNPG